MTDLPSVRSINNTTAPLRQAYELAVQVEALARMGDTCAHERKQFQLQLEQVASCLGLMLTPDPRVVVNNGDSVTGFGR